MKGWRSGGYGVWPLALLTLLSSHLRAVFQPWHGLLLSMLPNLPPTLNPNSFCWTQVRLRVGPSAPSLVCASSELTVTPVPPFSRLLL